jgi:predicted permease
MMRKLKVLWIRICGLRKSSQNDEDFDAELASHVAMDMNDGVRAGLSPQEARRQALIRLGGAEQARQAYRERRGLPWLDMFQSDIRYSLRTLGRTPGFTAVAILSLALGIGATTAMFSLIYASLLHPFPYAGADRTMNPTVVAGDGVSDGMWFPVDKSQYEVLSASPLVESVLGFSGLNGQLTEGDLSEPVKGIYVTENAAQFFGVAPLMGRMIQPSDAQGGGQHVAVLNYRFWKQHFQADSSVVGRNLEINHQSYTVVGVMPRSFAFNDTMGTGDVYVPMALQRGSIDPPIPPYYAPWIKLKKGVKVELANQVLGATFHQFAKGGPEWLRSRLPKAFSLHLEEIAAPYRRNIGQSMVLLLAGVLLLLAIGIANCTTLLLARGETRQQELSVRLAIGASRWRLVRQLVVEATMVSVAGSVVGTLAAYWLAQVPLLLSPSSFPPESVIRINQPILAFSLLLALVSGLLCGLFPALRLSRLDSSLIAHANPRRSPGNGSKKVVNLLVAGQIGLTLLLLTTSGMAIAAFLNMMHSPLGFDPDHVLTISIAPHGREGVVLPSRLRSHADRARFLNQVRQKVAEVPGVLDAAIATNSTPPDAGLDKEVEVSGPSNRPGQQVRVCFVSPEYFRTLRIPIVKGQTWDQVENAGGDSVVLVNQAFVRTHWPNADPLLQRLRVPGLKAEGPWDTASPGVTGWRQVVGIVADHQNKGIGSPVAPAVYLPFSALMWGYVDLDIRTQREPAACLRDIQRALSVVSSDEMIVYKNYEVREAIAKDPQWARQQIFSVLFGFFSTLALLLALIGLFSVVSYSVAQRTAEFGVRVALGGSRRHIVWTASERAARSVAFGITLGIVVDLLINRTVAQSMGIKNTGLRELMIAAVCLAACSAAACILPARHAASIDPAEALRYD